jgi:hypothetical protein
VNALTVAVWAAALALIGNMVFTILRLYRERRSIAAALAGEIGTYITLLDPPATSQNFRELAALDQATRRVRLRELGKAVEGLSVFDKIANKIAVLPKAEALEVCAVYPFFTGMRTILNNLSGAQFGEADDPMQIMTLNHVASMLDQRQQSMQELIRRLGRLADESLWEFCTSVSGWSKARAELTRLRWRRRESRDDSHAQP